jgi:SAM-dependent methyltransferase
MRILDPAQRAVGVHTDPTSPSGHEYSLTRRTALPCLDTNAHGTGSVGDWPTSSECPICRTNARRLFEVNGFWVRRCIRCRHCFAEINSDLDPVETLYGDDYFFGGGVGYPDYLGERDLLIQHGRRYGRLLRRFVRPGHVLDVGAAAGFLLQGLVEQGWTANGLEPNKRLAAYARQQFGLDVAVGTLETMQAEAEFDLITMIQVVAHFRHLRRAFEVAASITRPGGHWLIETWNHRSLTARLLGRYWHEWSPPSVLQWFSPASLARLSSQFGLRVIARGRAVKRLNGDHAKSLLRSKMGASRAGRGLCRLLEGAIPNRVAIPYPGDDVFWLLLQKNL